MISHESRGIEAVNGGDGIGSGLDVASLTRSPEGDVLFLLSTASFPGASHSGLEAFAVSATRPIKVTRFLPWER